MSDDAHVKRRKHSFEAPYDELQIATWFLFPLINLQFFIFFFLLTDIWDFSSANSNRWIQTLCLSVFILSSGLAAYGAYATCMTDPADDALVNPPASPSGACAPSPVVPPEDQIHCYVCEVSVHKTSKHCRYCDKCVVNFDHHCKWLNTCVGKKNYRTFLLLVSSVAVMLSECECLGVALLVNCYTHPEIVRAVLSKYSLLGALTLNGVRGVLIATVGIYTLILGMVFQLLSFHILLLYTGQTTYEFIISEQKRLREKKNRKIIKSTQKQISNVPHAPAAAALSPRSEAGGNSKKSGGEGSGGSSGGSVDSASMAAPDKVIISVPSKEVQL